MEVFPRALQMILADRIHHREHNTHREFHKYLCALRALCGEIFSELDSNLQLQPGHYLHDWLNIVAARSLP